MTRKSKKSTASVVPSKYRDQYKDDSCGDTLSVRLKKHVTGKDGVDLAKLRELAERNGVWNPKYAQLNNGMARMNVGNRLRALSNSGTKIVWK